MNIIQLILHIGLAIKAGKDGEATIKDLIGGRSAGADAIQTLEDISAIIANGVVKLPDSFSADKVQEMITELKSVI